MDIRNYMAKREAHLKAELARLREQIGPLERELFEIGVARKALGRENEEPFQAPLFQSEPNQHIDEDAAKLWKQYQQVLAERAANPHAKLTIKELVMKALREQFTSGASAKELLEFFESAWGRFDIARTSLSPQLSRLKAENRIGRDGSNWFTLEWDSENKAAADQ